MKECVVVLGMHRSGTSVLAGLVSLFGLYAGSDLMKSTKDNPKGYFENNKIYSLNEKILRESKVPWDNYSFTFDQVDKNRVYGYETEARRIINEEFPLFDRIFLKDPRMCLLFPFWEKVLSSMGYVIKVIFTYRSPMEVAASLRSRDAMHIKKSLMMWSHYTFQAERASRKSSRMMVRYDEDLSDLDSFIKELGAFLDIELNDYVIAGAHDLYTPKLKHHQFQMSDLSNDVPLYLRDFVSILTNGELKDFVKIDRIIDDFYNSKDFYSYNEASLYDNIKCLEEEILISKKKLEASDHVISQKDNSIKEQQRYIESLREEYGAVKGGLEKKLLVKGSEIESKEAEIRNKEAEIRDKEAEIRGKEAEIRRKEAEIRSKEVEIVSRDEKLAIGDEIFYRIYKSKEWRKKLGRTIAGSRFYKNKRVIFRFAKFRNKQILDDKIKIIDSKLFSAFYYLTQNPDVWRAGIDPLNHFQKFGWKEGRNPSKYFDCKAYLNANMDVKKSARNPLVHYIKYGKAEGRSPQVDTKFDKDSLSLDDNISVNDKACLSLEKSIASMQLPEISASGHDILVTILILNRDGVDHLKVLMPALYENTLGINYEIIVVDNDSKDKSVNYLENCRYDFNLSIIRNSSNESFSKANNQAALKAKGKYLVLLNNDVKPLKGWLHNLLYVAETNEGIGSVGSRLVYPFKKSFKNSCKIQHAGIAFRDEIGFFRPYNCANGLLIDSPLAQRSGFKSAVTAACLLVPKKIYDEVGGLDEGYNYGYEDVDFGLKLFKAGYHNYYCSDSILFHYEFGTQDKNNRDEIVKRRKANVELLKNKWAYFVKHEYWKEKLYGKSGIVAEHPLRVAITVTDYGPNVAAGDYFTAQELAASLEKLGWSVILLSRVKNEWYQICEDIDVLISLIDAFDLSQIPKRQSRLFTIAWTRNWFDRWCQNEYFHQYDLVFASSHIACDYVKENSSQDALLLPIASSVSRFSDVPDCVYMEQYKSDISFTGNYWSSPRDIMDALSEKMLKKYSFHIYGANWDKFEKFRPYHKGFIAYEDIPCVYHNTKIVIDDAVNNITKPYGSVNSRVFDALMAGALVITNGVEGSKDLFNGELPYYETEKELDKLLDYYLSDENARKQKISELKQMIHSEHTYAHRAKTIQDTMVKRFMSFSIAIKIPAPNWEGAHSWGDYHMAVLLKQQFETLGYYVLLQILPEWDNDEGLECDVAIVLRGLSRYKLKSHQFNIMWNISHPDIVSLEEYEEYDKVFIASEVWANKIAEQISTPVEAMLQCTDPERFREPNKDEKKDCHHQLLFVGNSREVYRKVLKDLIPTEYDLAVYGKRWKKIIPKKYIKGEHISNDELYKYYGSADILLNDHWDDMREQGFVSNRIFDGLACGAFILTDKVASMGELEKYMQTYKTEAELKKHVEYYLKNPDIRRQMAKEGMEYVRNLHTFKERAKVFSDSIKDLVERKASVLNIAKRN